MKISIASVGVLLLISAPFSFGDSVRERTDSPCFHVNIQAESVNRSSVQQNCDRNISRTVQAGNENWAQTTQTGSVNDNKVRQYHFDRSQYFGRLRGR